MKKEKSAGVGGFSKEGHGCRWFGISLWASAFRIRGTSRGGGHLAPGLRREKLMLLVGVRTRPQRLKSAPPSATAQIPWSGTRATSPPGSPGARGRSPWSRARTPSPWPRAPAGRCCAGPWLSGRNAPLATVASSPGTSATSGCRPAGSAPRLFSKKKNTPVSHAFLSYNRPLSTSFASLTRPPPSRGHRRCFISFFFFILIISAPFAFLTGQRCDIDVDSHARRDEKLFLRGRRVGTQLSPGLQRLLD
jgi:hypothetical protein